MYTKQRSCFADFRENYLVEKMFIKAAMDTGEKTIKTVSDMFSPMN